MADNHDYIALDWVKGEIEQALTQARTALESFVEQQEDTTQLTFCLNYIHQVHGTLQMVEFYGAALLAEEMEKLCQYVLDDKSANLNESLEVLMGSILQLQNYLEHIQTGQKDLPVILLPTLNDLRASQGEPLLSDTSLFTPDLAAAATIVNAENNQRMQDPQVIANLRKLRQMFQASLVGILRNQGLAENFAYLYKVLARLEKFCHDTPIGKIWWVSVGFLDAIQGSSEGLGSATKHLLRQLDHLIKEMIDEHGTILCQPLPEDLLKNMLYYIAKSDAESKRLHELQVAFSLSQALPSEQELDEERQKLQGPDKATMSSVVTALGEELSQVKDQLDLYVRGDDKDKEALGALLPTLNQIANTMAVLGLGIARKTLLAQMSIIEKIVASNEPANDQVLMSMAEAVLQVEASLASLTDDPNAIESESADNEFVVPVEQFESAHNAVIFESRNGLEQAKNSIVSFIASQWDHAEIEDVPDLLDSIRGGLQIIPLSQAATLLGACSQYIRESILNNKTVPEWQELDRLADAITSIEYYMERLTIGATDNEKILRVAEESLAKLGYSIEGSLGGSMNEDGNVDASPAVISEHHTSDVASESPDAIVKQSDDALIDDEILEIFIEEAAEVQVDIHQALSRIGSDDDSGALNELRRAFHTLKGSGRLVGATVIGELAWSIEDLLNLLIEQSLAIKPADTALLAAVVENLPALVEDFSAQTASHNVTDLMAMAEARLQALKPDSQGSEAGAPETSVQAVAVESKITEESEPEDDLIDDEILEIFVEEAEEVSETIMAQLPVFLAEFDNTEALSELRRAFHTLKGSGRMVGAEDIGETAWAVEDMLNRVIDGSILITQDIADLVRCVSEIIPELIENFKGQQAPRYDLERVKAQAEALTKGELVQSLNVIPRIEARPTEAGEEDNVIDTKVGIDDALLEIFESEARVHISAVEDFVSLLKTPNDAIEVDDALSRALHTLKGSANTASIACIAEVAVPLEKFIKEARARQIPVNGDMAQALLEAMALIREGLTKLSTPEESLVGTEAFLVSLADLHKAILKESAIDEDILTSGGQDPQLVSIFLTEGLDILLDAEKIINEWNESPVSRDSLDKLIGEVKTLHRGAKIAGLESIAELCDCLEQCYLGINVEQKESELLIDDIKRGHESLIDMMDQVAAGLSAVPDNKLLAQLREHCQNSGTIAVEKTTPDELGEKLEELEKELDDALPKYTAIDEQQNDSEGNTASTESILDPELVEIFLDEARDIVAGLSPLLTKFRAREESTQVLQQLERDFHTLKGGARMAAIAEIGDLSHALEGLFEHFGGQDDYDAGLADLLDEASGLLLSQLNEVEQGGSISSPGGLIERLNNARQAHSPVSNERDKVVGEPLIERVENKSDFVSEAFSLDPELAEIFLEEARDIIDNSGELLHQWETDTHNLDLVAELQRELHTLKGGARMAEIAAIGDIAHELETLFERIVENRFGVQPGMISLCLRCHDALANMVDAVGDGRQLDSANVLLEQVKQVLETGQLSTGDEHKEELDNAETIPEEMLGVSDETFEGDLVQLFLDESKDILTASSEYLNQWQEDKTNTTAMMELQREMHTLKGGARLADVDAIADIAGAAENKLEQLHDEEGSGQRELLVVMIDVHATIDKMLEALSHGNLVPAAPKLVARIRSIGRDDNKPIDAELSESKLQETGPDDIDQDVLALFVEEAKELSEALEEQTSQWGKDSTNADYNREIQRILHTLKGGARLSNHIQLADESHALESQLVTALENEIPFTKALKTAVLEKQDSLLKLIDGLQHQLLPEETAKEDDKASAPVAVSKQESVAEKPKKSSKAKPDTKPKNIEKAKSAPQETIRVSSGLMEGLVNLAGETSISRGRLETQISDFGFTLEEMTSTIERLREQLRRMEMETEAQVLFRAEKEGLTNVDYDDFDPLEMDRYSSIQQLSRSLTESTTDLLELRDSLADKARGAETLLLQQSRINSELQENLMKTRMIPFSSMVPRLRRIVRQISSELDKDVNFDVSNAEGEMDRSVLERMIAPLEHMLRNALDHGIESKVDRKAAGKPAEGMIRLSLSREGGDVVLKMKDDGAGIDDKRVREKAISQGLVSKSAKASRHDILQFIMLPGFSTAEKVTQISGRGVGMDVVSSEIKQMGGLIEIDSTLGQGTEFTVRLPFTVSVNRALMVNTGEDFYAIPLNTIEGIVRVSSFELEEYYKPDAPMYEYAGRKYKLQYLGKLLHSGHHPKLQGQPLPLPVILVRGTDQPMALQVDSLMGSREIVVKSLGPQFAGVQAVSGATILGDGSVVVILDLPALIRDDTAGLLDSIDEVSPYSAKGQDSALVMVIDDSVTVRKVTTRLLERNGMEVITAKDGVDAIAQLQDCKPDVMLLDIEMPRMDGFEVATLVRHDERLKNVPIIMITSRTGKKHRERALSIGVNEYLGKPFQEKDLLKVIERLI